MIYFVRKYGSPVATASSTGDEEIADSAEESQLSHSGENYILYIYYIIVTTFHAFG